MPTVLSLCTGCTRGAWRPTAHPHCMCRGCSRWGRYTRRESKRLDQLRHAVLLEQQLVRS